MKNLKKLTSLLLVAVMLLAMSMTAFAAEETFSITIKDKDSGHNYVAYQIISGKAAGKVLSDMKWAAGQTNYEEGSDAKDAFKDKNEAAIVEYVKGLTLGTAAGSSDACVNGKYIISGLTSGYYLVKDEAENLGKEDAYTAYILKVVGNVEADAKKAAPTVDKEVLDETADAEAGAADGWGETADHAINESFQFRLTATLEPDADYAEYETYKVVFNDTMSAGITFESIESVMVNDTVEVEDYDLDVEENQAGGNWSLTIADILKYDTNLKDGAEIVVVYNAHLNENAAIGNRPDNNNTVYLQYSNNPNVSGDNDKLGETKEDTVWVFTYDMENTKIDADTEKPLPNVEFELYDANGEKVGLFYDEVKSVYRPVKSGETAVAMKSAAETGKFNIVGLDAGTYTLKEVEPLPGYNACADITFTIDAKHSETETDAETNITYTGTTNANTITIENKKGTTLPETGGMGTTMFYVIGTVLVAGAAVVMITKKRMSK